MGVGLGLELGVIVGETEGEGGITATTQIAPGVPLKEAEFTLPGTPKKDPGIRVAREVLRKEDPPPPPPVARVRKFEPPPPPPNHPPPPPAELPATEHPGAPSAHPLPCGLICVVPAHQLPLKPPMPPFPGITPQGVGVVPLPPPL